MKRLILSLFALSFSLILLSCGDEDNPVNNNVQDSYDWGIGSYWKFKYSSNNKILTKTITDKKVIGKTNVYTVKYEMEGIDTYLNYWLYSPEGYNNVNEESDIQNSLDDYLIKFPIKKGDTVHVIQRL